MKTKLVLIAMTIIGTTTFTNAQPDRRDNDKDRHQNDHNGNDWKNDDTYYPDWNDEGNWKDDDRDNWRDNQYRDQNNHRCTSECKHGNCKQDCRHANCKNDCRFNSMHQKHIRFAEHRALRDGYMSRREYRYIQYLKNLDNCDQCDRAYSHRHRYR